MTKGGTVQTLFCYARSTSGDPAVMWQKDVYIPNSEAAQAYAQWLGKDAGRFFYTLKGEVRGVPRKPRNVPHWNE